MKTKDLMEKLTKPGLWFVKSMQPAMDISRMVYEVAVKEFLDSGCTVIVFVAGHYSGSVADFIESHLL